MIETKNFIGPARTLDLVKIQKLCNTMMSLDRCGPKCCFHIDKKGCYWRQGKTPNEWFKE